MCDIQKRCLYIWEKTNKGLNLKDEVFIELLAWYGRNALIVGNGEDIDGNDDETLHDLFYKVVYKQK
jgi:hypothetical protein